MAKRGRVSLADLMTPENPTEVVQRPDAPYDLDDDESAEWRAQVAAMPADHFTRSTFPMLAQMCRHIVASRRLAQLMQAVMNPAGGRGKKKADFDLKAYGALLTEQRRESEAITKLARAMRLTQRSMILPDTLGRKVKNGKSSMMIEAPWSKADEEET